MRLISRRENQANEVDIIEKCGVEMVGSLLGLMFARMYTVPPTGTVLGNASNSVTASLLAGPTRGYVVRRWITLVMDFEVHTAISG